MPSDREPARERLERLDQLSAKIARALEQLVEFQSAMHAVVQEIARVRALPVTPSASAPTGAVRCSLCGRGILKVSDVVKEGLDSKVAVVHQRCYRALKRNRPAAPARRRERRGRRD